MQQTLAKWLWCGLAVCLCSALAQAQRTSHAMGDAKTLEKWEATGDVAIDEQRKDVRGKGPSLRVGPGAELILRLREEDGGGRVDIRVFDDGTQRKDRKAKHAGPRWGLLAADGGVLVVGNLYAPYLEGDKSYAASPPHWTRRPRRGFTPCSTWACTGRRTAGGNGASVSIRSAA